MSPPWSRPLEVDRLADGGADVDFAIPLAELSGLRPDGSGVTGEVTGRAHFRREQGFAVAQLSFAGRALLACQRCLRPLEVPLDVHVRVALLASEEQSARVPPELEPVLAAGGRVSLGALVTEELLLSLPIVPLHATASCAARPEESAPAPPEETHRPFAQLAELMKRK